MWMYLGVFLIVLILLFYLRIWFRKMKWKKLEGDPIVVKTNGVNRVHADHFNSRLENALKKQGLKPVEEAGCSKDKGYFVSCDLVSDPSGEDHNLWMSFSLGEKKKYDLELTADSTQCLVDQVIKLMV